MRVHHRPFVATAVVCAAVFVITGLSNGFSRAFFQDAPGVGQTLLRTPFVATVQALLVLGVVFWLAWKAPLWPAVALVTALELVSAHATWVSFRFTYLPLVLAAGLVAVGAGLYARLFERSRAERAAAAEERARRDERLDMARELHDVVAHHVTGMLVQAQAALVVAEQDKDRACGMLNGIVDGGTDALGAMRLMVRTLRDNGAAAATGDLSADLLQLVEKSGLQVRANVELPADVPPELGRSVLRLVQESLTNVRKHAVDATDVEVDVRLGAGAVMLSVVDNGTARPSHSGGFGLVGMRERVHELGGRFFAGPTGEGWLVTAELPLEVRA
ncbi:sensor histidine kinase [Lentzea albida]|uniref:histidine kinase n=1 Tax=Lentzea albida TaxID=65499 RepID=A0A1H9SAE4_9PSEU|nr:histidine kinase [Lentzea albida]SER81555.1 Signal transduction histidine kinase [Lentzea albida]